MCFIICGWTVCVWSLCTGAKSNSSFLPHWLWHQRMHDSLLCVRPQRQNTPSAAVMAANINIVVCSLDYYMARLLLQWPLGDPVHDLRWPCCLRGTHSSNGSASVIAPPNTQCLFALCPASHHHQFVQINHYLFKAHAVHAFAKCHIRYAITHRCIYLLAVSNRGPCVCVYDDKYTCNV